MPYDISDNIVIDHKSFDESTNDNIMYINADVLIGR